MSNEEIYPTQPVDRLLDLVEKPKPKENKFELALQERAEYRDILDRCMEIRMLTVCEDDEILLRVGRYWYSGKVMKVGKLGVVLQNQGHEVAVALGKISVVEIIRRGRWYEQYKQIKG